MSEPRNDRWIRLYDLGCSLRKSDPELESLSRPALRQRVYRMVREAERFHNERFTKRWRNRLYVNLSALDRIKPPEERRLGQLETNQAEIGHKVRHLERQQNAHGARIRNLERWRAAAQRFLGEIADIERTENATESGAKSA